MTDARAPVLSLEGIDKAFGFNVVLRGVGFDLFAGEVLALVGENGAGKSTLMNIVSGSVPRDSGRMVLSGAPFSTRAARRMRWQRASPSLTRKRPSCRI